MTLEEKRDAAQYSDIYDQFIERSILSEHDRTSLHQMRGFSTDTIEQLSFRSCGLSNVAVIEELTATYGASRMRESGLTLGGKPNHKLVSSEGRSSILIPYLSESKGQAGGSGEPSNVVYIRPHKDALAGLKLPLYTLPIRERSIVILTESEFKAAAAWQLGYSAIGIAGISYASKNNYESLKAYLTENDLNVVCIIFDNEKKDEPRYANFKKYFWERYDTQYYSYLMAAKLCSDGFDATVGVLPERWMVDGKIDIDGALAAGHGRPEFMAVIARRLTPDEYLRALPDDVATLIRHRWQKSHVNVNVFVSHNKYFINKVVKDVTVPTPITDFTFNIDSNIFTPAGECKRELTLTNSLGDVSAGQIFDAGDLAHHVAFRKKAMTIGNYLFNGTQKDLEQIVTHETAREIGKRILQPDHVGWVQDAGMYLFSNYGLTPDGDRLEMDDRGIVWKGLRGFQAIPLEQSSINKKVGMPSLHHADVDPEKTFDLIEQNFAGFKGVRLACAWLVASLFSHRICSLYENVFPILFLAGEAQSGKTTLAKWLCSMAGQKSEGYDFGSGSLVSMTRGLSYYSSQPFWLDEFRNSASDKTKEKGNFLRSAYDGQVVLKALRTNFGVRGSTVRGRIILSGQDTPSDHALQQRCVTITMLGRNRTGTRFDELNALAPAMSGIIPVLCRRWMENEDKNFDNIKTMRAHLRSQGLDDRTAITYSIPTGVYDTIVKPGHKDFLAWCGRHASTAAIEKESEKPNRRFLTDIQTMIGKQLLNGNAIKQTKDGELAIHYEVAFTTWREMLRRAGDEFGFKSRTLMEEIEQQTYFIRRDKSVRMGDQVIKCLILSPDKDEQVGEIFDAAKEEREFE
jgi:hypothetical protein